MLRRRRDRDRRDRVRARRSARDRVRSLEIARDRSGSRRIAADRAGVLCPNETRYLAYHWPGAALNAAAPQQRRSPDRAQRCQLFMQRSGTSTSFATHARRRWSPQHPCNGADAFQRGANRIWRSAGRLRNVLRRRRFFGVERGRPRDARRAPPPRAARGHNARRRARAATPRGRASRGRAHSIGAEPSRTARALNDHRTCGAGEGVLSMARGSPMTPS